MGNMMKNKSIKEAVFAAMDIMDSVSEHTDIVNVPGVARANKLMRSVGFGIMGHHGYIAENLIPYGSKENLELVDVFFNAVNYWSLLYSMNKAKETGSSFYRFEKSTYADGSYFDGRGEIFPEIEIVKNLFEGIYLPTNEDWAQLKSDVMEYGVYHSYRQAIAPTGSISYVMSATASLTPVRQVVEERTYGNSKTYFPMPNADKVGFMYENELAYDLDNFKVIDVVAMAQKHIDQGISFEVSVNSNITTRELQRTWLYAHHKGVKTLYYLRQKKLTIDELEECESCAI